MNKKIKFSVLTTILLLIIGFVYFLSTTTRSEAIIFYIVPFLSITVFLIVVFSMFIFFSEIIIGSYHLPIKYYILSFIYSGYVVFSVIFLYLYFTSRVDIEYISIALGTTIIALLLSCVYVFIYQRFNTEQQDLFCDDKTRKLKKISSIKGLIYGLVFNSICVFTISQV